MRSVPGFTAYAVDADGAVYRGERRLKPCPNGRGYLRVFLRKDGATYTRYVHRLVCEAFHGSPEGREARHRNGVRDDNRAENLIWGSHLENEADKERHGTLRWGEAASSRLTAEIVIRMRNMVREGASMQDAARAFGIPERLAASAITGRRWGRLPGAIEPYGTRRRFTPEQVRAIRALRGVETEQSIAKKYGVTRNAVNQIMAGKSYAWV